MNEKDIMIIVLITIIFLGIGIYEYKNLKAEAFNSGMDLGRNQTINAIYKELIQNGFSCKTIPLSYNNITINLIARECLK